MQDECFALTRVYHPSGAQVSIPIGLAQELTVEIGALLLRSVDNLLASGWSVNLPGVELDEKVEEIGFVGRREKFNTNDNSTTPIVDLYPNKEPQRGGAFKLLHMYLNTPDDIAAFENATGVSLNQIPLYNGDNAIERGKGKDSFILQFAAPVKLVWKQNPAWEGDQDKKHPKRIFVRWFDARPAIPAGKPAQSMTLQQALKVKTANGAELGTLAEDKLRVLAAGQADWITADMQFAAKILLANRKQESE